MKPETRNHFLDVLTGFGFVMAVAIDIGAMSVVLILLFDRAVVREAFTVIYPLVIACCLVLALSMAVKRKPLHAYGALFSTALTAAWVFLFFQLFR